MATTGTEGSLVISDIKDFQQIAVFSGGGSCPLGKWTALLEPYNFYTTPVYIELYTHPINLSWGVLSKNPRVQVTRSTPNLAKDYIFGGRASAVVVRPGPRFEPSKLYKVTLYSANNYSSWLLTLTFGVYPDIHRYVFGDSPNSVLIEEAPANEIPVRDGYYDVESYYKQHPTG